MKKIVIFINSMRKPGGIERVVSNLLKEWSKIYDVILITKDDYDNSFYEIPLGVKCYKLGIPLELNMCNKRQRIKDVAVNYFKSIGELRKILRKINFDYIYTTTPLNSLEVYMADHNISKKLVISEHASAFAVNRVYQLIKRYVYPKSYCISVCNKTDVNVYKGWGCNAVYIPHLITFTAQKRDLLHSKIALNVGRYTSDKRQSDLINIWRHIEKKNEWKLWIVGMGEEQERLQALIDEYYLNDSVYLKPPIKNIEEIYKKAALFLFTSRAEGFGMVLLEAMAFGIPCISYDCPSGPRDIIENGKNGLLIENNDWKTYSQVLEKLINENGERLEYMSENAFGTVKRWNSIEIMEKWDEVYK